MPKRLKALSIWQPWASMIAVGVKRYETRSWSTKHRGFLLVCASKNLKVAVNAWHSDERIRKALSALGYDDWRNLPFGEALAVVDLVDCQICGDNAFRFADDRKIIASEKLFGDFSPGRYAWKLENVRAIEPFPVRGRQGLFKVEVPEGLI